MEIGQTLIPSEELEIYKALQGIEVVFDVGARVDIDYLELKPNITCHFFEPCDEFFEELTRRVGDRKHVYLNHFAIGDKEGLISYADGSQAMLGSEAWLEGEETATKYPMKTLDWYIAEKNIQKIDFLKIDIEGYDYKALLGGEKALALTRYLQYEYWNDRQQFIDLLEDDFHLEPIGYRNVLCISKTLISEDDREELVKFIRDRKMAELS